LVDFAQQQKTFVTMEELALPFASEICRHMKVIDRQGSFSHSRFLDACRFYNSGSIGAEELQSAATILGFVNVIDAFHRVRESDVGTRFFIDERASRGGITLTDDLLKTMSGSNAYDLRSETEERWNLVEEAWDARSENRQVVVLYDSPKELLVPAILGKRQSIAEVRPALNGYQRGHCFYCFGQISLAPGRSDLSPDVDHFFPFTLMTRGLPVNLNSPWNLVLTCQDCNRGGGGKFASLPHKKFVDRLHTRNEHLIGSHHPLRETLIHSMGRDAVSRRRFLEDVMVTAAPLLNNTVGWTPREEGKPAF
jgi:5-methylcytosine-specific restriction endonuclease McrA